MDLRRLGIRLAFGALGFALASTATAQSAGERSGDAQVGFERKPRLTAEEMLIQGDAHVARIQLGIGMVRKQIDGARNKKDVVKTLCLDDKRSQMDVAARAATDRMGDLRKAVRARDMGAANHEYTMLARHRENADRVLSDANQCVGVTEVFTETTQREMRVDSELLSVEVAQLPSSEVTMLADVPQEASPKN